MSYLASSDAEEDGEEEEDEEADTELGKQSKDDEHGWAIGCKGIRPCMASYEGISADTVANVDVNIVE